MSSTSALPRASDHIFPHELVGAALRSGARAGIAEVLEMPLRCGTIIGVEGRSSSPLSTVSAVLTRIGLGKRSRLEPPEPSRSWARSDGPATASTTPGFEGVQKELAARGILCDFRPETGLRLGPRYFTTDDELEYAAGRIAEIVDSGAYERHVRRRSAVLNATRP